LIAFCCLLPIKLLSGNANGSAPDTIRIGLLTQDKSAVDAVNGARLAIEKVNRSAGTSGYYFLVEGRSMEGPWGTGSKQSVDLIFKDISILIVSADGRNSHLVEQVSAKTQVPMISVQSSDPTLAQAFIPWYFSCVPNDISQSECLLTVIHERRYKKPLVISDNSYDNLKQSTILLKTGSRFNYSLMHFRLDDFQDNAELIRSIRDYNPDCILLFIKPDLAVDIISGLKKYRVRPALFGSLSFCNVRIPNKLLYPLDGMTLISPGYLFNENGREFARKYFTNYGSYPCFTAAFAYDAVNTIAESYRISHLGSSGLKEKLQQISMEGITGKFSFDKTGSRIGLIELMTIKNDHFIKMNLY
jgi:ABC-type branched-subunit amino acid transport system substrate-binding protein